MTSCTNIKYKTILDRFMCLYELETLDCAVCNKHQLVQTTCWLRTGHSHKMTKGMTKTYWGTEGINKLSTHLTNQFPSSHKPFPHSSDYNLTGFGWDFSNNNNLARNCQLQQSYLALLLSEQWSYVIDSRCPTHSFDFDIALAFFESRPKS